MVRRARGVLGAVVVFYLAAIPLALAQDRTGDEPVLARPAGGSTAPDGLVALGRSLSDRIAPILHRTAMGADDNPCPLENGMPRCFDPAAARAAALRPVAVNAARDARILTLEVVETFAALLGAVASADATEANAQARALEAALGGAGVFGAVLAAADAKGDSLAALMAGGLPEIADLIAKIDATGAVVDQSTLLQQSAAAIDRMIGALIDETPRLYEIYRFGKNEGIIILEGELAIARNIDGGAVGGADAEPIETQIEQMKSEVLAFHEDLAAYVIVLERRRNAIGILVDETSAEAPEPQGVPAGDAVARVKLAAGLLKLLPALSSTATEKLID